MLAEKRLGGYIDQPECRIYVAPERIDASDAEGGLDAAGRGVLYDGAADAASKILRIEGAGAFYKGATARMCW